MVLATAVRSLGIMKDLVLIIYIHTYLLPATSLVAHVRICWKLQIYMIPPLPIVESPTALGGLLHHGCGFKNPRGLMIIKLGFQPRQRIVITEYHTDAANAGRICRDSKFPIDGRRPGGCGAKMHSDAC